MIGGNIDAELQIYKSEKNEIGEDVKTWTTVENLRGYLDMTDGGCDYKTADTKTERSTHVFICDYSPLEGISAENCRLIIDSKLYNVVVIDNPMNMNCHYEIYLEYTGG